jgi:UDP-N-acetylmuramoylalanine--D-glutamate ligase
VILKKILKSKSNQPLILEIPSAQLEYFELAKNFKPPKIAVITNLYIDHLNRHGDLKNYALAKARIFSSQKKNDFLILNYDLDNSLFLRRNPKSKIFYVSLKKLPVAKNGLYFAGDKIIFQNEKKRKFAAEIGNFSPHQKYNLLISLLAGRLYGKDWREMTERISSLPSVKFRQEVVFKNKNFVIVNDSAATSPDGAMAAIDNFGRQKNNLILVTGGTDKKLEFGGLSDKIKKRIKKENLFLLNGSATHKLVQELKKIKYFKKESEPNLFENLKDILRKIKKDFSGGVILFSPASASFEKFKNEFDRGKKFNRLVKLIYGK